METDSIEDLFRRYGDQTPEIPAPGEVAAKNGAHSALTARARYSLRAEMVQVPLRTALFAGFAGAFLILCVSPTGFQALIAYLPL